MKKVFVWALLLSLSIGVVAKKKVKVQPQWPDGSVMSEWFADTAKVSIAGLGELKKAERYLADVRHIDNNHQGIQLLQLLIDLKIIC